MSWNVPFSYIKLQFHFFWFNWFLLRTWSALWKWQYGFCFFPFYLMRLLYNFYVLLKLQHCHHGTRKQDLIASLLSSYEDGLWYKWFSGADSIYCKSWFITLSLSFLVSCYWSCSPLLQRAILNKTGTCVRISCKAESLVWRALVISWLLLLFM